MVSFQELLAPLAVRVTFVHRPGELFGLIAHNGAGKSNF